MRKSERQRQLQADLNKKVKRRRYTEIIDRYDEVRERLLEISCMDESKYFEMEFQTGFDLVESFYEGLKPEKVQGYIDRLTGDQELGFWSWLKVNRRQMEAIWFNRAEIKHAFERGVYNDAEARMKLILRWELHNLKWATSQDTHRRFFIWLTDNRKFKI